MEVEFDPSAITYRKLMEAARGLECAAWVYARDDGQWAMARDLVGKATSLNRDPIVRDKQPKYHLAKTPYRFIPLTDLQAVRVNSALGEKRDPIGFLSPRQQSLLAKVKATPGLAWPVARKTSDLVVAWERAQRIAGTISGGKPAKSG